MIVPTTTRNVGFDAFVDAIAERLFQRLQAAQTHEQTRLLDVKAEAKYIGRSPSAIRHMEAKGILKAVRRDGRVYFDIRDLDAWVEMGKAAA